MGVAFATLAGREVVLKIAVSGEGGLNGQRGAAEVGVEDNAGSVNDVTEGRFGQVHEGAFGCHFRGNRGGRIIADLSAGVVEDAADFSGDKSVREAKGGGAQAGEDFVDGRKVPQKGKGGHVSMLTS